MSEQIQLWAKRVYQAIGDTGDGPLEESIDPMPSHLNPADVLVYFQSVFGPSVDEAWTYVDGVGRETIGWVFNTDENAQLRLGRKDIELVAIPMIEDPAGDSFVSFWARMAQQRALFRSLEEDGMNVTWVDAHYIDRDPVDEEIQPELGAEPNALAPELLTLLQLDPEGQGTVTPAEVAHVCRQDRDLVLSLIRDCEVQVIEWRYHAQTAMAEPADPADAAVATGEAKAWQQNTNLLRAALRRIVLP